MRWDIVNPWGRTLEKLSSHPLVARRIQALEKSGLPGAPRQWNVLRAAAAAPVEQVESVRAGFARELFVAVAPWAVLLGAVMAFGLFRETSFAFGLALTVGGILLLVKQTVRYPTAPTPRSTRWPGCWSGSTPVRWRDCPSRSVDG